MNPLRGTKGRPIHPPVTDVAIGAYSVAFIFGIVGLAGGVEDAAGKTMWLALLVGLGAGAVAAVTGLADWVSISRGTSTWSTATTHMLVMVSATVIFAIAAFVQYDGFHDGKVETAAFVLTAVGFATLAVGGWLGGRLVFVHGMRVVEEDEAPPELPAAAPAPRAASSGSSVAR